MQICMISEFCHSVNEIFCFLGHYTTLIGIQLPTIQDILLVPPSRVKQFKNSPWTP